MSLAIFTIVNADARADEGAALQGMVDQDALSGDSPSMALTARARPRKAK
jgi:hypothetical protein